MTGDRPAMPRDGALVGIDLGATHTRVLVTDVAGNELALARTRTPHGVTGAAVTETVVSTLDDACRDAGVEPGDDVAAVGVGSLGPLDIEAGRVVDPPNLPGVDRIDLADPIRTHVAGAPVELRNDAVAGVLGERDALPDAPGNLVYLTISTGIGAGVIVDDHVLSGRRGNAAEVGHFVVDPHGRPCGCGGHGHWEAYAAGAAIPDYARDLHAADPVGTELPLHGEFDAAVLFAHPDDPLAARVIDRLATWNTIGVANLVHAFAPDRIVIGGGVARNNPTIVVDAVRERLPAHLAIDPPTLRVTELGDRSVLRGAIATAREAAARQP